MPFSKVEGPKVYKYFVLIGLKLIFFSLNNALFFPLSYMYINVIMTVFNQRCLLTFIFDQLYFNSVFF